MCVFPFSDLPVLLEQDPDGGQRVVSGVSVAVRGEPGRLQAAHGRGDGPHQGREATEGRRPQAEGLREQVNMG